MKKRGQRGCGKILKKNSCSEFLFSQRKLLNSKHSQVTIFIILALIIVVTILLIVLLQKSKEIQVVDEENPQAYIESCVKDSVEEAIENLSKHGGDIKPKGSIMYNGTERVYLCYNRNYYKPCINQRPMLIKHIREGVTEYIEPNVNSCFNSLERELEDKNYNIEKGNIRLSTVLRPHQVLINMDVDFVMTKNENTKSFDSFKVSLINPIYDFAEISNEIASQEAKYCYFNVNGFNSNYPEFEVRKDMIDNSKIYSVRKKGTDLKFIFAIRGCVMPAGF